MLHLFQELADAPSNVSMATCTSTAYGVTLANFHPWPVRAAVAAAVYALPSRTTLLRRLGSDEETARNDLRACITAIRPVYDMVQAEYSRLDLHALP
jgi:hypothetical protein